MTNYVDIFKALGDQTRFTIFNMLKGGSMCACNILQQLDITQPTLSHHMQILCQCGLVVADKQGKWTHYSLDCNVLNNLIEFMSATKCNMH